MKSETGLLTPAERDVLARSALVRHQLEEQFQDLEQQHETAAFGMWVFLATEVMFFGVLFLAVAVYHTLYPRAVEAASARLNWQIGGINTIVLLVSSFCMVLAVHYARLGRQRPLVICLLLTAILGLAFLGLKGLEYYEDFQENLVPGARFDPQPWIADSGLSADQVAHVELFLLLYWIMTGLHGVHVTIGIVAVLVMAELAHRGHFSRQYNSPVDVTALYWHFVDTVWIFLLPTLYLLGTHAH